MIPTIRVTTIQPGGSCHECGREDYSSPYILMQRRDDGRLGGPVDSEAQYCGRCESIVMERLRRRHEAYEITLIDAR